jgi:hypothetical protein
MSFYLLLIRSNEVSTHQILGPYEYSRFGYALTTVDLNKDGIGISKEISFHCIAL